MCVGFLCFWLCHVACVACEILAPRQGIEPRPSAVKAWNPNHWTTREFPPGECFFSVFLSQYLLHRNSQKYNKGRMALLENVLTKLSVFWCNTKEHWIENQKI